MNEAALQTRRGLGRLRAPARAAALGVAEATSVGMAGRPRIPYFGPARSTNAGDALLHEVHRALLPGLSLPPVQTALGAQLVGRVLRPAHLLLGGGTLIGERRWRELLQHADPHGQARVDCLGTGVLDPRSPGFRWLSEELPLWVPLLRRAEPVPVRGPLSAEVLADLGLDTLVVGDPVLSVTSPAERPPRPGLLGVNIGATLRERTFGASEPLEIAVAGLVRAWRRRGGDVIFISVWPPDEEVCRRVAARAGTPAPLVAWHGEAAAFVEALQQCEVVLAQKLHAAVLAVVARRPVAVVEYQAKCRDFAESVGLGPFTQRMDACSEGSLVEAVTHLQARAEDVRAEVERRRTALLAPLHDRARRLCATEGLPGAG